MRLKMIRMTVAALTVGLVLTGCGSDDGGEGGSSGAAAGDQTLTGTMGKGSTTTNPLAPGEDQVDAYNLFTTPLLQTDDKAQISSQILESWETSDDATTVTLVVKDGWKWSDGQPITGQDLYTSLDLYLDGNISSSAGRIGGVAGQQEVLDGQAEHISGLKVDGNTVTVSLAEPNVAWVSNVAARGFNLPLLPDHVLGDLPHADVQDHEFFKTWPVVSGPYELTSYKPGESATFERNDSWSGGKEVAFKAVNLKVLETDQMIAQLRTGEIQFAFNLGAEDVAGLEDQGAVIASHGGIAPDTLGLNYNDPRLADPRVRQALIYAIDREQICTTILAGRCSVPIANVRQVSPDWAIPTDDVIEYSFNQAKARDLLAAADFDTSQPITLLTRTGLATVDKVMTAVQGMWEDIGLTVKPSVVDTGQLLATLEKKDASWQAFWVSGADFSVDPVAMEAYASCGTRYPDGSNTSQYCDPETDSLWAAGLQETDPDQRATIYQDAFRRLNNDPSEIYLYVPDMLAAHVPNLTGVVLQGNLVNPYWNIADWGWED